MLSGFESFPKVLPEDIVELPHANCLYGKMEYYEAMFSKLVSGQFLKSIPRNNANIKVEKSGDLQKKEDTLEWFKSFDIAKKQQYMKFLLDLAHEFNNSEPCMRLYTYLDCYDRSRGIKTIPDYTGIIPTDYATYLNFFETLYLILITETLDISLVDEMYRFCFFAACNNPVVQKSELLSLGYQYPNIMDLYDFWSEYIRKMHLTKNSMATLMDEYPQFERDLHSTYRLYLFAQDPQCSQKIRFINSRFDRVDVTFSLLDSTALESLVDFQESVVSCLPKKVDLFAPLAKAELAHSLKNDICVGVYYNEELIALLTIIPNPQKKQNIMTDIPEYSSVDSTDLLVVDCILVLEKYRGFGLQRAFFRLAEFIAEKCGISKICCTSQHILDTQK